MSCVTQETQATQAPAAPLAHESIQGGRGAHGAQAASVPGAGDARGRGLGRAGKGGEPKGGAKNSKRGQKISLDLGSQIPEECGKMRGALRRTKPILKPIPSTNQI